MSKNELYKPMTINDVLNQINKTLFLPAIQRNYVWLKNRRSTKIEDLFDSIYRGYPVSTFLFWTRKREEQGLYEFVEDYNIDDPAFNEPYSSDKLDPDCEEVSVVLDGQQRLTSLYLALKGTKRTGKKTDKRHKRNGQKLYLNLTLATKNGDEEEQRLFCFKTENDAKNDKENKWFLVRDVLIAETKTKIKDWYSYNKEERACIEKLWLKLTREPLIYVYHINGDLSQAVEIFTRMNSGGEPLSASDLLLSLATSTNIDIRENIEDLEIFFRENGFGLFKRDHILKSCLLMNGVDPSFRKGINKEKINKIDDNWESTTACLETSVKILKDFGYVDKLSSGYIITTIALYLYLKRKIDIKKEEIDILRFVQNAQIEGYFSNTLDKKLRFVRNKIENCNSFKEFNQALAEEEDKKLKLKIDKDSIENILKNATYGKAITFPVLQMLYPNLGYESNKFHIDHIYPKSRFRKGEKGLPQQIKETLAEHPENDLFNLQLLKGEINQEKLNMMPNEWMDSLREKKEQYIKDNYIPENIELSWENFDEFRKQRTELIKKELYKMFDLSDEIINKTNLMIYEH